MAALPVKLRPTGQFHYGWVIIAILAVVQIFGQSISMSAGIMVPELREPLEEGGRFGWPPAFIGFALAGYYLVGSLTSPFSGRFGDLLGARKLIITGGLLFGVSMVLIGYITSVWQFFIVYSVMLALTSSISMVPLMAAVNPWFRKRLGLGIGIMWAAGGVGAAVLAPVYSMLLVQFGWTATFVVIGLVGGAAILGLMPFFRNLPADKGLLPYGATENDPVPAKFDPDMAKLRLRIFQRQMKHTRAFWNLPVIHGMGCAGHGIVLIFVVDYAVTRGIDFTTGAVILTLINVFSIMGRFAVPIITERVGGKLIMATALSIQAGAVVLLFFAQDVWAFYLFGCAFGIGFGGEMSAYPVVNRQYFGTGPVATIYGFQISGAMMGHFVSTLMAGLVIQFVGYVPAFVLSMAFSSLGVIVVLTLETTRRQLIPNWEDQLPPEARTAVSPSVAPPAAAAAGVAFGNVGGDGDG